MLTRLHQQQHLPRSGEKFHLCTSGPMTQKSPHEEQNRGDIDHEVRQQYRGTHEHFATRRLDPSRGIESEPGRIHP